MKYDFNRMIDRVQTNDIKWNAEVISAYLNCDIPEDVIPVWLADTDFACAPIIVDALRARVDKKIFGYCTPMEHFHKAVCYWHKKGLAGRWSRIGFLICRRRWRESILPSDPLEKRWMV